MTFKVEFLPCGDTGLVVQFGNRIERGLSLGVVHLKGLLAAADIAGVTEAVPTYRSLLIHYNPLLTSTHRADRANQTTALSVSKTTTEESRVGTGVYRRASIERSLPPTFPPSPNGRAAAATPSSRR